MSQWFPACHLSAGKSGKFVKGGVVPVTFIVITVKHHAIVVVARADHDFCGYREEKDVRGFNECS
jgi:hypothetical protein